jgi:predicted metal-binding membrane protein
MSATPAALDGRRLPLVVPAAIVAAWVLAVAAQMWGGAGALHHDALIEGTLPRWASMTLFLVAWQAMLAAMMLPSALPLLRLFVRAGREQPHAGAALAAFIGGYALIWTMFGYVAFVGDVFVHGLVHRHPWLAGHSWVLAGGVLVGAGAFQFSKLKDRCLRVCRNPGAFLLRFYERGTGGAFRLGRRHGLFCVGCCWALMLVAFAAGVANLWWMAALTALMVYEKTAPGGRRSVPVAGFVLIGWGALVLAHPAWLPVVLGGGV